MEIYLLDIRTNQWFAGQQRWTSDPAAAVSFGSSGEALERHAELEKDNPHLQVMLCFKQAVPVFKQQQRLR